MNNNFSDFLNEIQKVSSNLDVYIPSLNQKVGIKPITLQQQKSIIESSVDSTLGVLFFNNVFHKIIAENSSLDTSKFNTIDRVTIALSLRNKISPTVNVEDKQYTLTDVLVANEQIKPSITPTTITTDKFTFHVSIPSLRYDNTVNAALLKKYNENDFKRSALKSLIGDLFVYEIIKFVSQIDVVGSESTISLRNDNIKDCVVLIESIDSNEFTEVIKYINKVREIEKQYTQIPGTQYYIDIVPDFFVV
jgi:hypothetical protein